MLLKILEELIQRGLEQSSYTVDVASSGEEALLWLERGHFDTVILDLNVENNTPDLANRVNGIPPINTQRAVTQVLVNDGQTTAIGGIYTSTSTNTRSGTPGLTNVPLLGWLFRKDTVDDQNTELLIFITPRIITPRLAKG